MIYYGDSGPPDPPEGLREEIQDKEADLATLVNLLKRARSGGRWISDGELRELAGLVDEYALPVFQREILDLKHRLDDDEPRNLE